MTRRATGCYLPEARGPRPEARGLGSGHGADVNLDAAIHLPSFRRGVGLLRTGLAVSGRGDAAARNAVVDEIGAHRSGAPLGQVLVVRGRSGRVGVTLDVDDLVRIAL